MFLACGLGIAAGIFLTIEYEDLQSSNPYPDEVFGFKYGWSYFMNWMGAGVSLFTVYYALFILDDDHNQLPPPGSVQF